MSLLFLLHNPVGPYNAHVSYNAHEGYNGAYVGTRLTLSHQNDAVLYTTHTKTHSSDAWIGPVGTYMEHVGYRAHFTYRGLTSALKVTQRVDAIAKGVISKSHAADAAIEDRYTHEVMADSPVAYWRLDEATGSTAKDHSGNGYDGNYVNAPYLGQPGPFPGYTATKFVATESKQVTIPSATALHVAGGTDNWTLEAWFQGANAAGNFGGPSLLTTVYDGTRVDFNLGFYSGAVAISAAPSVNFYNGSHLSAQSATAIDDGNWHHLVGTFDGTNLKIYVDGVLKTSTVPGSNPSRGTQDLIIAKRWDTGGNLNGTTADVAIYNTALSSTRITAHYNAGIVRYNSHYSDALIASGASTFSVAHTTNAIILKTGSITQLVDSIVLKTASVSQQANAIILKTASISQLADAIVLKTSSISQQADAYLFKAGSITQNADAIIQKTASVSQQSNAIILKTGLTQQSADAIISKTASTSQQADAVLLKAGSVSQLVNAIVLKTSSVSQQVDAIVSTSHPISQSVDAIIQKSTTVSHSTDAIIASVTPARVNDVIVEAVTSQTTNRVVVDDVIVETVVTQATKEVRVDEVIVEIVMERDYIYVDGTLVLGEDDSWTGMDQ